MIRAEVDSSNDTMGKKIRLAVKSKIPNVLVVGEREEVDNTITLRRYGREAQEAMTVDAYEKWILDKITTRSRE